MLLRTRQLLLSPSLAVGVCLALVLAGAPGCRKSARELTQESHEEEELLQRAQWEFQQAEAQARNLFDLGKEHEKNKRYKEAVEAWAMAVQVDERVDLSVKLAKNLMADQMIKEAYFQMHRPNINIRYPAMAKEKIDLILDPANGFMDKHVRKANEAQREYDWIRKGWEQYDQAKQWVEGGKIPEGRALLESICKNYPKTPLADLAMVLLQKYKPKKELSPL
jgi:tetratricopeptide (TPR) repeat protein